MGRGRKPVLVPAAIEILKQYDSRITIRQLYYRLVGKGILRNKLTSYNILVRQMINARRDGRIPYDAFEDRTRYSLVRDAPFYAEPNIKRILEDNIATYENADETALENLKNTDSDYDLPLWWSQPFYVEVWVEKQALNNLFEPITEKYHVTFVPCRGYPSVSLLYECAKRLRTVPPYRKIHILYFGDYDVRGFNIVENIDKSLNEEFGVHAHIIRCALSKEQIEQNELPPAPAKKSDSMAKGWIETQGDVAWELDALEPHILETIIENSIAKQINFEILKTREKTIDENRQWLTVQVDEYLAQHGLGDV